MMKRGYIVYALLSILVVFFVSSCGGDRDCRESIEVKMRSEMYTVIYDSERDEYRAEKLRMPIYVSGEGVDSLLYDSVNTNTFDLYLRDDVSQTHILLGDTTRVIDTITIGHNNTEEFISFECGSVVSKKIESVGLTTNLLDSVIVKNANVNTQEQTHLYLYLKNR